MINPICVLYCTFIGRSRLFYDIAKPDLSFCRTKTWIHKKSIQKRLKEKDSKIFCLVGTQGFVGVMKQMDINNLNAKLETGWMK